MFAANTRQHGTLRFRVDILTDVRRQDGNCVIVAWSCHSAWTDDGQPPVAHIQGPHLWQYRRENPQAPFALVNSPQPPAFLIPEHVAEPELVKVPYGVEALDKLQDCLSECAASGNVSVHRPFPCNWGIDKLRRRLDLLYDHFALVYRA